MPSQVITIENINQGGISDTPVAGFENSVAFTMGANLHKNPSLVELNQRLVRDDNNVIDEPVSKILIGSDSLPYAFGRLTGKVWQRSALGVWELLGTVAPEYKVNVNDEDETPVLGEPGIMDAAEADGWIYYATRRCLGRYKIGEDFSYRDDSFGQFENADPDFHPILIHNDELNVGDGNVIANVAFKQAPDYFAPSFFRLYKPQRIKTIAPLGNQAIIGTFVNDMSNKTQTVIWNTYSSLYEDAAPVEEIGINAFIPISNNVLISAGVNGSIYGLGQTGRPEKIRTLPGNFSDKRRAFVHANAVTNFQGLPVFGVSNGGGNPCRMGIYSFGSRNSAYPQVLNMEWPISQRTVDGDYVMENIEITAISAYGELLLVAWADYNDPNNPVYGIDILDEENRLEYMEIETRVMQLDRMALTKISKAILDFFYLPNEITAEVAVRDYNGKDNYLNIAENVVKDETRGQMIFTQTANHRAVQYRVRVGAQPNGDNISPVLESINFVVE